MPTTLQRVDDEESFTQKDVQAVTLDSCDGEITADDVWEQYTHDDVLVFTFHAESEDNEEAQEECKEHVRDILKYTPADITITSSELISDWVEGGNGKYLVGVGVRP